MKNLKLKNKIYLSIIGMLLLTFVSCKKSNDVNPTPEPQILYLVNAIVVI